MAIWQSAKISSDHTCVLLFNVIYCSFNTEHWIWKTKQQGSRILHGNPDTRSCILCVQSTLLFDPVEKALSNNLKMAWFHSHLQNILNYYFQKTYIAPEDVSQQLFGFNLTSTIATLDDPTIQNLVTEIQTPQGQAFVATSSSQDQDSINALSPRLGALSGNLTSLNNGIQARNYPFTLALYWIFLFHSLPWNSYFIPPPLSLPSFGPVWLTLSCGLGSICCTLLKTSFFLPSISGSCCQNLWPFMDLSLSICVSSMWLTGFYYSGFDPKSIPILMREVLCLIGTWNLKWNFLSTCSSTSLRESDARFMDVESLRMACECEFYRPFLSPMQSCWPHLHHPKMYNQTLNFLKNCVKSNTDVSNFACKLIFAAGFGVCEYHKWGSASDLLLYY